MALRAIKDGRYTCGDTQSSWRADLKDYALTVWRTPLLSDQFVVIADGAGVCTQLLQVRAEDDVQAYYSVAIVTLLAGLLCFAMALVVARAHSKTGILAPAMTGDPYLERCNRAHANTLEWMPIFLPAMWLFAIYWSPMWATIFGSAWIVGRIVYFRGYAVSAKKRAPGFFIQAMAVFALSLGTLGRIVYLMSVP